jgi:hypothetical protein
VIASISTRKRSCRVCFFFDAYSNSEKLDCIGLSNIINMMNFIKLQQLKPICLNKSVFP